MGSARQHGYGEGRQPRASVCGTRDYEAGLGPLPASLAGPFRPGSGSWWALQRERTRWEGSSQRTLALA